MLFAMAISVCLLAALPASGPVAKEDWKNAADLTVEGRGWIDPAAPFVRLPERVRAQVRSELWDFSRHSSGIAVCFTTSSNELTVRWKLTLPKLEMAHTPATAVSGLDLYVRDQAGAWRYVHNFRPEAQENTGGTTLYNPKSEEREYRLYLPLYNGVESLQLAAPQEIKPSKRVSQHKPIVVYGTSISQGACASRPGMAWPSIVGRQLDRELINMSFAGNGRLDLEVAKLMGELDASAFVLDPLWNVNYETPETIVERSLAFIGAIRAARPDTPIVMVGEARFRPEEHPTPASQAFRKVFDQLTAAGDRNLCWIDGKRLLGDDGEATVDGIHSSDLGMLRQANVISEELRKLDR